MKRTTFFVLVLFLAMSIFTDTIYLKSGQEYKCILKSVSDNTISVVMKLDGSKKTFKKEDVNKIKLDKKRKFYDVNSINKINDPDIKSAFNAVVTKDKYGNSNYVNLLKKITIDYSTEHPVVTEKYIYKVMRKDGIRMASSHSHFHFKRSQNLSLDYAVSISATGHVESIYENLIADETLFSKLPNYIDLCKIKFSVPKVEIGSLVAYQVTIKYTDDKMDFPLFLDETFEDKVPYLNQIIEIIHPEKINYEILNKGKFNIKTSPEKLVFSYSFKKEYTDTAFLPPFNAFAPRIIISDKIEKEKFSKKFQEIVNNYDKDNLKNYIQKIDVKKNDPVNILKTVYNFIQDGIVNAPISPRSYSYYPHSIDEILKFSTASPLDKTVLAQKILSFFNIDSSLIFASTRFNYVEKDNFFNYKRYSYPILKVNSHYLYFGAITQPYMVIPYPIYGQKYYDVTKNEFGNIPSYDQKDTNFNEKMVLEGNIGKEGDLSGKLSIEISKLNDAALREMKYRKKEDVDIIMQQVLSNYIPQASLSDYEIKNYLERDKKIYIVINFKKLGFASIAGSNILFNIPLIKFNGYSVGKDTRELPVFFADREFMKYIINIKLPDGYRITYVPKNIRFNKKYISINSSIINSGTTLSLQLDKFVKKELAPRKFYFKYKKAMSKMVKFSNSLIVGEKK